MKRLLGDECYDVAQVEDGQEGLEYILKNKVDLILTDCDMPRMGGYGLINELTKLGLHIPVIMLSGRDDITPPKNYLGKFTFISKGDMDTLKNTISEMLE